MLISKIFLNYTNVCSYTYLANSYLQEIKKKKKIWKFCSIWSSSIFRALKLGISTNLFNISRYLKRAVNCSSPFSDLISLNNLSYTFEFNSSKNFFFPFSP